MNNQFYIPDEGWLKNVISLFWQVEGATSFDKETIIPSGITEIIFNFSCDNSIAADIGTKKQSIKQCLINGFNTSNITLHLPEKQCFFGVRFRPAALKNILGVPAGEFANEAVDLTLVDNSFKSLWHLLAGQNSFYKRVAIICNRLTNQYFDIDPRDLFLNKFLSTPKGEIPSVRELSDLVNYSPRHLSRKIYSLTGMNTEETLLYKKYLHSVHLIHTTKCSLTEIAYDCLFADQSHFIKTFKSFTGITPGAYRKTKTALPGHILKNVR